ncbi:MAG: hypothetical protein HON53_22695 [Planctomycetaceae bacterium]|jgi:uncharacterized protein YwgA|nr:hypothetical protein [Planctomycetaceae bacterium]MBT6154358.1 hypothetical protein [Planctomycetaceae bacterium]MBT6484111.1 hypothetical protein [Planctomycetaceae bacterium]MBT6496422.1 hypothetical protein [Planctomycetaceae bacterium]
MENYRWLAGLIAAHPDGQVVGRTRLQKEVKLLQSLGFPTDYAYMIHFYGPYSEGLHSDIGLLEGMGFVTEEECLGQGGNPYYIIETCDRAPSADVSEFNEKISLMVKADSVVLELAATYDAFRDTGADHEDALRRVRRKKGSKCDDGNLGAALSLLGNLELQAN